MRRGFFLLTAAMVCLAATDAFAKGKLLLKVTDSATGEPIAFRIHLRNEHQVAVKLPPLPFWFDHSSSLGSLQLDVLKGNYFFEIEHGPEFVDGRGYFTINDGADDEKTVSLKRTTDMAADGWRSADFDVRRPPREIELTMLADDLRFVPLVTWNNRKSEWTKTKLPTPSTVKFDDARRMYDLSAGADDRPGGPIHLFRLPQPAPLPTAGSQLASHIPALRELKAQHPELWIDVAHPSAWDLPLLAAAGLVDSFCVLSPPLQRTKVDEAPFGRPYNRNQFPGVSGLAEYACDVYFHLLNTGLRVPPSAGSGSGTLGNTNPVGYNRLYVWNDPAELNEADWWGSLKQGRAIITNGPLIRPRAEGRMPGFVFTGRSGEPVVLDLAMDLTTRDKIDYVEVIQNGKVVHNLPLRDWAQKGGHFPPVVFRESGWCLIRARCDHPQTGRLVMSAPWYVEIDAEPSVRRASAQFFLDWTEERAAMLKITDVAEKKAVDEQLDAARAYWRKLIDTATTP